MFTSTWFLLLFRQWSYCYFRQWVTRYPVLHIHTPLWSSTDGDFNLHTDSSSSDARQLNGVSESFSLHQYVDFATHIHGHFLDLMICSPGCNILSVSAYDLISDHFSVAADLQIPSNHCWTVPQTIKYRKLQAINIEAFKCDIKNSELIEILKLKQLHWLTIWQCPPHSHQSSSPLVTKAIPPKPPNLWMTPVIWASERHCRYLERIWHRDPTALNRPRLTS